MNMARIMRLIMMNKCNSKSRHWPELILLLVEMQASLLESNKITTSSVKRTGRMDLKCYDCTSVYCSVILVLDFL